MMRIKNITITSQIEIYIHDNSKSGISRTKEYNITYGKVDSLKEFTEITQSHSESCQNVIETVKILGKDLVGPSKMVPGKTAHIASTLSATITYESEPETVLYLEGTGDPFHESADIAYLCRCIESL